MLVYDDRSEGMPMGPGPRLHSARQLGWLTLAGWVGWLAWLAGLAGWLGWLAFARGTSWPPPGEPAKVGHITPSIKTLSKNPTRQA